MSRKTRELCTRRNGQCEMKEVNMNYGMIKTIAIFYTFALSPSFQNKNSLQYFMHLQCGKIKYHCKIFYICNIAKSKTIAISLYIILTAPYSFAGQVRKPLH